MKKILKISGLLILMVFAFSASIPQQQVQQQTSQQQLQQQQQQQQQLNYYREETNKGYKQYAVPTRKMEVPDPDKIKLITITQDHGTVQNGWTPFKLDTTNQPLSCAGCANFFYMVKRSEQPHQAEDSLYYFYYYIFVYSNSFYADGTHASTYLKEIVFKLNGTPVFRANYILAEAGVPTYAAWIRYVEPTNNISIEPTNITVH